VTSYKPHNSQEVLWMSPQSNFEPGKPIRGGIPVCFPWFGLHKTDSDKPQHGFARLMYWEVVETAGNPKEETEIRMQLCSSNATKVFWPHDFCAELTIVVGSNLELSLKITNPSGNSFDYTCALHSYYNISSIENIAIMGLHSALYHSQLEPGEFIQEDQKIEIRKAETRHYHNTEATCLLEDPDFKRKILIAKTGSKITTVWNPGAATCANIDDLPNNGFLNFVCIEAVNAFENVITLAPKESHTTSVRICLEE
jgi:glucose-6-phosphate 1-epimerase